MTLTFDLDNYSGIRAGFFWLKISHKRWQMRSWTPEHLCVGPTGFWLAPSDFTLDDLEGSKIKVILFDVKYVKNGNSYDVGPNEIRLPMGFTVHDLESL